MNKGPNKDKDPGLCSPKASTLIVPGLSLSLSKRKRAMNETGKQPPTLTERRQLRKRKRMQERQLQELQKQEQERQQRKLKKKQQKQEQEKQKQDQHKQEHQQPQQEQQQQIEQQRNQQAQQQKQQIEQQQHTQQKIEQEKKLMEQQQKQQLIERQQQQQINQEEKQQAQKQKQLMEQQQQQQQQQKRPREQEQNQQIRPDQEFLPIHESSNSPQKHQSTKMNKENLFSTIISDKEQQQQQNCKPPPKKRQHVQTSNRDDDDSSENSSSSLLTQADKQESESDCHSRDHSVSVAIANDESLCQSPLPHPFMNDDGDDDDEDDDDNNASSTTQIQSLTTPKRSGTTGNIKQAHIDHDSDESQASPIKEQFSYMQKRNNNMKRNHQRFLDLGIMKKPPTPRVVIAKDDDSSEHSVIDEDDRSLATGMMFATRSNGLWNECDLDEHMNMDSNCRDEISPSAQDIFTDFPHRRKQIFLLQSCLGNSVRQMEIPIEKDECGSALNTYSPPPIFVTGPSGTGKTSVVRRILRDLKQESLKGINGNNACNSNAKNGRKEMGKRPIGVAYINCSTMEPYGTGPSSILESTYTQLANQMAIDRGTDDGKRVRMRTNKFNRLHIGSSDSLDNDEVSNSCSDSFGGVETDEDSLAYNSTGVDSLSIGEDTDDDNTDLSDIDDEDMIENCATNERSGFIKAAARPKPAQQKETPRLPQDAPRRSSRLGNPSQALTSVNQGSTTHRSAKKKSSGLMGILSTPASFGRSITQFCGVSEYNSFQRGCAFLVLDHADMLLSFSHNKQKKNLHTNFLSELLLLPQIMSLNLTIIVITDKLMLENTRISNIEVPTNILGTILSAITPFRCHFEAYQSKIIYRDILATPHLVELVTGVKFSTLASIQQGAIKQLYGSLTDIIIQSVESTTHDIREMLRLVRMLWPIYLEPLGKMKMNDPSSNSNTISDSPSIDRDTLEKLGQHLRPHLRRILPHCLLRPGRAFISAPSSLDPTCHKLPYLSKFLLLAAYLCQTNKADQDRILYTNQRTGQRRNNRSSTRNNPSESLTHGSNQREAKMERMTSFPLERMLSVFSSICNKYAANGSTSLDSKRDSFENGGGIDASRLGNVSLMNCLTELRQHGFIEEASNSAGKHIGDKNLAYSRSMTSVKFMCTLSEKEAKAMAKNVNFPLNEYLLENK